MDRFVTVTKPATGRATNEDKNNSKERANYRYNPYSVRKSDERRFEQWKDRKKTEK